MRKTRLSTAIATVLAATSTTVFANGLAINEQSASSAGTSYAGRASTPRDASTIYANPAGLSRLDGMQISVGAAFITAKTDISDAEGTFEGTNDGDMVPDSTIPFGYFSQKINDKLAWGVGVYVPYGLDGEYEDTFQGRLHSLGSEVSVVSVQPTISYQITDRVSIGFGPSYNKIEGKLTNGIPDPVFAQSIVNEITENYGGMAACASPLVAPACAAAGQLAVSDNDTHVEIEGDDDAYGYNLGILVAISDNLDWGVTYHSRLEFELDGSATITHTPAQLAALGMDPAGKYNGKLEITMPESIDTSFSYRVNAWAFHAGATWTQWSRLETLQVESADLPSQIADGATENLQWEDTFAYAIGASYDLNDQWQLRAGFGGDPSPTRSDVRTVSIPVGNRHDVTLGAGWNATANLTVDMAYGYIWEDDAKVNQETYSATFENTAHVLSGQVTYRF